MMKSDYVLKYDPNTSGLQFLKTPQHCILSWLIYNQDTFTVNMSLFCKQLLQGKKSNTVIITAAKYFWVTQKYKTFALRVAT